MKGKYKVLTLLFILLSLLLCSAYLYLPNYFQSLDSRVRDFYFNFRGSEKVSDAIVIVDIDEKSIKELGQWPWERDKIAKILTNLSASGAGIIGLDIVFSEADKTSPKRLANKWGIDASNMPDYDLILSKVIGSTPTILGVLFDFDANNTNEAPQIPAIFVEKSKPSREFLPVAQGVLTNIKLIQDAGYSSGYMNNIPDEMGIIRSVPLLIKYEDQFYPSLSFEMFRIAISAKKIVTTYSDVGVENIRVGKDNISSDRFGKIHLNFRGPAKSYRYISAVDVYNNRVDRKFIEGKFVLIGTSAYGLMDTRATPMDSVIAGVEIHANMIDNLLNKDMLKKPVWTEVADLFIIIFTIFIVLFIYSRFSLITLSIVYISSFVGMMYLNYYLLFTEYIILNSIFPLITVFFSLVIILAVNYMFESRLKEIIKSSFSKKVSKQVMEDLLKHPDSVDLTTKDVNVSIYFSDIRSFTTISETLKSPKRITEFLNYYMDIMVQSVEQSSGTVDKFIGDAIMAYWNAPLEVDNHADKAVKTALKQIGQRDFINIKIKKDFGFEVDYGIGINTGPVVVGEIGSQGRSDYTIIGDAVNLASRVEGLCKPYKVRLVISEFTKAELTQKYVTQLLDIVTVKGKTEPVKIYEVLSEGEASEDKLFELESYEIAHNLYVDAQFQKAKEMFDGMHEKYGKYLYELYAGRCEHLLQEGITEFDGVFKFTTK